MDFSFIDDARLQQQLHDLVYYTQSQRRHNVLPRVDSVRFHRIGSPGQYGVSIELVILKTHPESYSRAAQRIDVAIRVAARFPAEMPLIACTLGAENLPAQLKQNGQLTVPWLQTHAWPDGYSLSLFVSELCTALNGTLGEVPSSAALVHPAPTQQTDEQYAAAPQFGTEEHEKREVSPSAPTALPPADARVLVFKCKWRNVQKRFTAAAPRTSAQLTQLIKAQFVIDATQPIVLKEFLSSQLGAIISSDEDVARFCGSGLATLYIIVEDGGFGEARSVDLLGLDSPPSPVRVAGKNQQAAPVPPPSPLQRPVASAPSVEASAPFASGVRQIPSSDFKVIKSIGIGSSCRVYLANWRGSDVAVKAFTAADRRAVERECANEVEMMTRLGCHPSLVLFLGVCPSPLSIVFEYLPFSLFELINGVKESDRKIPPFPTSWTKRVTMMLDLAKGLQFLHSFDIIHRNLLVTHEGRVKLADFGISRVATASAFMTGCCGTFQWMAPEVIVSERYSLSADIYSFGVILWEICERAAPFVDLAPGCVPIAVVQQKRRPRLSSATPQALQSLIQSCWQEDAARRPTAADAVRILQGFFPPA